MSTYLGWSNYATWAVYHCLEEEAANYDYWASRRALLQEETPVEWSEKLADELESFHDEDSPELAGMYGDLLGWALGAVNWKEVAHHIQVN